MASSELLTHSTVYSHGLPIQYSEFNLNYHICRVKIIFIHSLKIIQLFSKSYMKILATYVWTLLFPFITPLQKVRFDLIVTHLFYMYSYLIYFSQLYSCFHLTHPSTPLWLLPSLLYSVPAATTPSFPSLVLTVLTSLLSNLSSVSGTPLPSAFLVTASTQSPAQSHTTHLFSLYPLISREICTVTAYNISNPVVKTVKFHTAVSNKKVLKEFYLYLIFSSQHLHKL